MRFPGRVLLLMGLVSTALAQQPTAASEAAQQPDGQPTATLQLSARRVIVDIVVTDAKGKSIKGLGRDDFQVFEDGKTQPVRSFEQHASEAQPPLPKPDLPPNTFSNLSSAPQNGPVTVILYDLLNTPLDAQAYAHMQLLDFLKHRSNAGQVAIFVLSDKLHMLQGFTDDDNQLIAALNQQGNSRSTILQGSQEVNGQSDQLARSQGNQNGADADPNVSYQTVATMLKHMEAMETSALLDRRVDITVEALEEIARFLVGLPGRKNLLWLSGSFPAGVVPDSDLGGRDSFDVTRNYSSTMMEATDLLNLSHVAVYPVDVRGLQVNPMFSAASNQTFEPGSGKDSKAVRDFFRQTSAEHSTMDLIGDQTGGRAFYNTNGLKEAVATAVDEGSVYYTLSYAPSNPKVDGGLRHVKVELMKPGYHLSYRRSYFADNLDSSVRTAETTPNDPLAVTLEHGAPSAHELFFEAYLQTMGGPTAASGKDMETLAQYKALQDVGKRKRKPDPPPTKPVMMQRYVISYGLLLRQLQLSLGADGQRRGDLEFAVLSFDADGNTLNGIRSQVQDVIPPARYAHLQDSGYQLLQTIAVPTQAASLRLAVRDVGTNRVGSLEVRLPLKKLPPTEAAHSDTSSH